MSRQLNTSKSSKTKMNLMNKQASLSKFRMLEIHLKLLKNDYQNIYLHHYNISSKVYMIY
jgi:hypothetical protein